MVPSSATEISVATGPLEFSQAVLPKQVEELMLQIFINADGCIPFPVKCETFELWQSVDAVYVKTPQPIHPQLETTTKWLDDKA